MSALGTDVSAVPRRAPVAAAMALLGAVLVVFVVLMGQGAVASMVHGLHSMTMHEFFHDVGHLLWAACR